MAIILSYKDKTPRISASAFVADNAVIIGDVEIAEDVSVWFGCVLRGDVGAIRVGARSNIQDLACLHTTGGVSEVHIGQDVTVGHSAILHGCRVGHRALVGMGSIVLDNAEIGEGSVIGAGSLVTARTVIPARSMVLGRPGKVVRSVTDEEANFGSAGAAVYVHLGRDYRAAAR